MTNSELENDAGFVTEEEPPELINARQLLPVWFVDRMMTDSWSFGLMMSNGTVIGIQHITKVSQAADGTIWIDVKLMDTLFSGTFVAPTSRLNASINVNHVMAAFELADT